MQVENDKSNVLPNAWPNQKNTLRDQRENRNGETEDSKYTAIWKQPLHKMNHYINFMLK